MTEKGILHKSDPLDFTEFILKVENYFQIKIPNKDYRIKNLADVSDLIIVRLKTKEKALSNKCSSQYIFYRIRKFLTENNIADYKEITPNTNLRIIFKSKKRRQLFRLLEDQIEYSVNALRAPKIFSYLIYGTIATYLLFCRSFGFSAISTSVAIVTILALLFTLEPLTIIFRDETLGDLVKRIKRDNYLAEDAILNHYNAQEIEEQVVHLFKKTYGFVEIDVTPNTTL